MADTHRPFAEQVAFFRQKLNLPTERWDDIQHEAHDRAFIVAGAQAADLLDDLNAAVLKTLQEGTGLNAFRKDFQQIVARNGWTGWTGEGSQAGVAWRTKVIYQTNMATSYAAGRYQQLTDPELLAVLPYWQYKHADGVMYPRPLHVAWNGLTLPPEHEFWQAHFPPNGWGCHCRVTAVPKSDYLQAIAAGKGPAAAPAAGNIVGIDKGFAYTPGASVADELRALVEGKVEKLPGPIGQALAADSAQVIGKVTPSNTGATNPPAFTPVANLADAEHVASDLLKDQNQQAWPMDANGDPLTVFAHRGAKGNAAIAAKYFGKASLKGLDVDTANEVNRTLLQMQSACDALGIPRLRGLATMPASAPRASMGDGVLSLNENIRAAFSPAMQESQKEANAWTPGDQTTKRADNSFQYYGTAVERLQSTLWHEFAHHIHQLFQVEGKAVLYRDPPLEKRLTVLIKTEVRINRPTLPTTYAEKNTLECFAECYSLHKMGRDDLLPEFMKPIIAAVERGELP